MQLVKPTYVQGYKDINNIVHDTYEKALKENMRIIEQVTKQQEEQRTGKRILAAAAHV